MPLRGKFPKQLLRGSAALEKSKKTIVIVGPCSIHDIKSAKEYVLFLKKNQDKFKNSLMWNSFPIWLQKKWKKEYGDKNFLKLITFFNKKLLGNQLCLIAFNMFFICSGVSSWLEIRPLQWTTAMGVLRTRQIYRN